MRSLVLLIFFSGAFCADPILYYPFDQSGGTTVTDSSGNGYDGIVTDGIWATADVCQSAQCLYFDQSYVTIPVESLDAVVASQQVTIMFWADGDSGVNSNRVAFRACANSLRQLSVQLPQKSSNDITWDCGEDGSGFDRTSRTDTLNSALSWNHWTFTNNVATGEMVIYLNGVLYVTGTSTRAIQASDIFVIGTNCDGANDFEGYIDDFRVYDTVLSLVEIEEAMLLNDVTADECTAGTHDCDAQASCSNTFSSFTCDCNDGYSGDGVTCDDTNECDSGTDDCDTGATCTNTDGSFTCACGADSYGNGVSCTACATGASADAGSTESSACTCNEGYYGDGHTTCTACATGATSPAGSLLDTDCVCNDGYNGDGHTSCIASLLYHFKFDETSGTAVADSAPGGSDATLTGTATWESDDCVYDGCMHFSSGFVVVPVTPLLSLVTTGESTVMFWAKGDDTLPSQVTIVEWLGELFYRQLVFHPAWDNGSTYYFAGNGGGDTYDCDIFNPTSDLSHHKGAWHHIALTKDISRATMTIYVDGVEWQAASSMSKPYMSFETFVIGSGYHSGGAREYYTGSLDDFRVYS
eukprot:Rmarinus@m.2479